MVLMANRYILPAALQYQKSVAQSADGGQGRRRFREGKAKKPPRQDHETR